MELKVYLFVVLFIGFYEYTSCVLTLEVDAKTGHHPISPDIYGLNIFNDMEFAKEIKLPFNRFGGNQITRYNWKTNLYSAGSDWFFENKPLEHFMGSADEFTEKDRSAGVRTMISIGMIGWTPKDEEKSCGFSVKKYGEQQTTDVPSKPDCGNGVHKDGKYITGNDPHDTSVPVNVSFAAEWVQHLVKRFGPASKGGVLLYQMDNEYDLWEGTHRDVRPKPVGTDEIIKLTEDYSSAIKQIDPDAKTLGPVGWSYPSILKSGADQKANNNDADRKAHGNIDFGEYYLKSFKALEDKHKKRLLDYFDCHYYPQSPNVMSDVNDTTTNALRLRATRSLWDTNYIDESWIKGFGNSRNKIQFIPRMKKMISDYYPETKTAITEYYFGAKSELIGAIVQADVLGIFGREGLDLASLWMYPSGDPKQPWAYAFRMFRNYDGKGSQFGDTSVTAKSSDQDKLAIYASVRSHDNFLVVIVINKEQNEVIDTNVSINGFEHKGSAKTYTYSKENLNKIVEGENTLNDNILAYKFPAFSITLFAIPGK